MSKRSGRKSQGANDFLMPYPPTINSVSDVGTARPYDNGAVTVSFTPDSRNAATSYTASGYCSVHGTTHTATGSSSPLLIEGFGSEAVTTITVTATNAYGTSAASAASNSVTVTTVPATPGAPSATAQGSAANDDVSWSAPATGGSAITSYTWTSSDGKSGTQAETSVSVAQEAGTSQTYNVYATNANGNSGTSSNSGSVTSFSFTPFGFAPFGAFGFTPFGFTPFGAFGFTPFGFTPFGAFGFTPFGAFGFTPFGAFAFSPPRCIEENTLIDTPNGQVAAKDLQVGDEVYTVSLQEVPLSDETGQYDFDYVGFESDTLTSLEKTTTTILSIDSSTRDVVLCFNNEQEKLYSTSQPIFVKSDNKYQVMPTGAVSVGDYLVAVNVDGSLTEILVESIDMITKNATVYQFNCEPADWFIAGGYLVHNK